MGKVSGQSKLPDLRNETPISSIIFTRGKARGQREGIEGIQQGRPLAFLKDSLLDPIQGAVDMVLLRLPSTHRDRLTGIGNSSEPSWPFLGPGNHLVPGVELETAHMQGKCHKLCDLTAYGNGGSFLPLEFPTSS